MPLPRWISALLVAASVLSSLPAAVLAAPSAPSAQQAPSAVAATVLLVLQPPVVAAPPQAGAFDAAGYVNVEHARHYADVQAQLDALQKQGAIAGYAAQPAAYAFAVTGASPDAVAALAGMGSVQPLDAMTSAAVSELASAYGRQLNAAIADSIQQAPTQPDAPARPAPILPPLPDEQVLPETARLAAAGVVAAGASPRFTIYLNAGTVYGDGLAPDASVTVALKSAAGAVKGTAAGAANGRGEIYLYPADVFGNGARIIAGDVVELQAPDLISIPVLNLQVVPSSAARRLSGFAPPNITAASSTELPNLYVAPAGFVTTDGAGAFAATNIDLLAGDYFWMRYTGVDGHSIYLDYGVPVLAARGYLTPGTSAYYADSYVSGSTVGINTPVTITLTRPGSAAIVNFAFADEAGRFALNLQDQYGKVINIRPGDALQATDGLATSTLSVPAFSVISDGSANTLTGVTDATVVTDAVRLPQSLSLWPMSVNEDAYGRSVFAPGGGFSAANPFYWQAQTGGQAQSLDWGAGQVGHLRYLDAEGDAVFQQFRSLAAEPLLQVRSYGSSYVANVVSGFTSGPCVNGMVTLRDTASIVKDQNVVRSCYAFDTEFRDVYGNALPILPGDSVEASFGGATAKVVVPLFTMSTDAETNVVTGQIAAGLVTTVTHGAPQSLAIYPGADTYGDSRNVQPDGGGAFRVDLTDLRDIQPGDKGIGVYIDAGGNAVFGAWQAPLPKLRLSLRGDGGYVAANFLAITLPGGGACTGDALHVVVRAADGAMRWQDAVAFCNSTTLYLQDDFANAINLAAGDTVEATLAGRTTMIVVPGFTNLVSDPRSSTVWGVTNAEVTNTTVGQPRTLALWPAGLTDADYGKHIAVAADGAFSAANPFYWEADPAFGGSQVTWEVGQRGHLRYIDAGGNAIYAPFAAMTDQPILRIHKDSNGVSGLLPAGGVPVRVSLLSGSTVKGVGYGTANDAGEFTVAIFDGAGNPLEIAEGDVVVLADPAVAVSVPPLNAAVDPENDLVSGVGPANVQLNVSLPQTPLAPPLGTVTDGAGAYVADFRGLAGLEANSVVRVAHQNGDGHTVWIERLGGAMLAAALNTGRVWGYAPVENAVPIQITVKRNGLMIGADSLADWGYFTAFPVDAGGKPVRLAVGDMVELDFGGGSVRTLTLAPLSIVVNEATNTLGGSGPASSRLGVVVNSAPYAFDSSIATDAAGQWAVDLGLAGVDIDAGDTATVRYSPDGSDTTWLFSVAPVFHVRQVQEDAVRGYAAPYAPVNITLKRDGIVLGGALVMAAESGYFDSSLLDVNGLPIAIKAGDALEIKHAQTVTIPVPVLQVVLNRNTRTVSGIGPANVTLGIVTNAGPRTVQTDGQGLFSATFPNAAELSDAILAYREGGGNWIYARVAQQIGGVPSLRVRWDDEEGSYRSNAVSGLTGAGPRTVLLTLRRGAELLTTAATGADDSGAFSARFWDATGQPIPIAGGDSVEMEAGDVSRSMTVPPLTVQANLESGTLFGGGPANRPLETSVCGSTTINPAGTWIATCAGGMAAGDNGYVSVTDLAGNRTWLDWSVPGLRVRQNGNEAEGTVALGAAFKLQLQRAGAVVAETSAQSDASNGWFNARFFTTGGSPAIIAPGDVVAIEMTGSDGERIISVPVGPLSAAADTMTDRVTGMGPAGEELVVSVETVNRIASRRLTTALDGTYTADFSGALDLRAGAWIEIQHVNAAGHVVWMGWNAPQVRINLASDIVDGFATPNALARLVLKRGGAVAATAQTQTAMDGRFSGFFVDGAGNLIDLVAGDVVEVTASPAVEASAIALTASLDPATDRVTGSALPGSALLVGAWRCTLFGCYRAEMTIVPGADGAYTADFSGSFDLDQASYAYVQATDAEGNQTSITTLPAETPRLQRLEANLATTGATLLKSGAGAANAGNLSTPLLVNVLGGGRLVFRSFGGELVITAPDGTITRAGGATFTLQNAAPGIWKVQVDLYDDAGVGAQYGVAAGQALYGIYMPAVTR